MEKTIEGLVALVLILSCLVLSSDGDCRWQWSEWSSCNPGFFSNILFKRDRTRLIIQAPVLSRGERCDFSLSLESPELETLDGSGLVQSQPCSTRDTAAYNGYCVEASMGRCANGFCISKELFCNQDDDCQDRSDESNCTQGMRWCNGPDDRRPVHDEWSVGIDLLSGDPRHKVLDTGFNGDCKSMTDGDQKMYRQPYNVFHVSSIDPPVEQIRVKSFTDYGEFMKYVKENVKHVSQRASIGNTFHPTHKYKCLYVVARLSITTEKVDMKYESELKPSKQLYKDLHDLPADLNNQVYTKFIHKYGTHFWSKFHRGGSILIVLGFDRCVVDAAREHVELDMIKFLTEVDPPEALHKRVREYFYNVSEEYVHITGGLVPHNFIRGSAYSVKHMNSSDVKRWKSSVAVSPQALPSDAVQSEEPVLMEISKLFHESLLTVRRWDRVRTNLDMTLHRYLSIYDDTTLLCQDCDGDDVIITPDIYSPAPSRFGCLCVTRDQRMTPICYPRVEKLKENPDSRGIGVLDKWVIIALTVVCLALVIALVYIAITIRGKQKQQGLKSALNPWRANSPRKPNRTSEHKKLSSMPKPPTKDHISAKKALLDSESNSFRMPTEEWSVNLEEDIVADIAFVDKTSEIQLAVTYPYKNKVLIYNSKGIEERNTEFYNITLDVPQGITYHKDVEKIVVCEWGAKCVTVLPTTLDAKVRSFVIPSSPWSVSPLVDSRLAISTCEHGTTSAIYIYSITGVMQQKFQIDDTDRRCSMEEFGEEHLLVVNLDGKTINPEAKIGRFNSPMKRSKSRNSRRKTIEPNDNNEKNATDNKNSSSPLIETPVYAKVNKKIAHKESIKTPHRPTIPELQENHADEIARDTQLAVFDKNGQYQWNFREAHYINPDLHVTSVCVSRLPISDPSWQDPELANIQVLVSFATNVPSQMLQAFSPEGHALDHAKFLFKYENSYGILRNVSYSEGFVALHFDKHIAVYEGVKMLKSAL